MDSAQQQQQQDQQAIDPNNQQQQMVQQQQIPMTQAQVEAEFREQEKYIQSKQKSLAETKKRRKDIDRDAQLLANRIALLKQEEMKTWKKIEETKKRTGDILNLKRRNEEKIQKKIQDLQHQSDEQRQQSQNNYLLAKQRQYEKRKIQEAVFLSRHEEAKQSKAQRAANDQVRTQHLNKMEQENRMKNQIVNQQKTLAHMKIQEEKKRKVGMSKQYQQQRVAEEEAIRRQKEEEVMQMEQLEMELIKKLQNTQAIQKETYQQLENALREPSAMMAPHLNQGGPPKLTAASKQKQDNQ